MLQRTLLLLLSFGLLACSEELVPSSLGTPSLEGALTEGEWERRQRRGITFWLPKSTETRFPEMVDFSCVEERRGEVRITVTGDTSRTSLWFAEDTKSARDIIFVTSAGEERLSLTAGALLLPSVIVRTDEPWLQPLVQGEGRFAVNAYGQRTYRMEANEMLSKTLLRCGTVS